MVEAAAVVAPVVIAATDVVLAAVVVADVEAACGNLDLLRNRERQQPRMCVKVTARVEETLHAPQ